MKWFIILVLLFNQSRVVFSCECLLRLEEGKNNLKIEIEDHNWIGIGKITKINVESYPIKYQVKSRIIFKGEKKDEITILSGVGGIDCGFVFEEETEYLIFGIQNHEGEVFVSNCSRTNKLINSGEFELLSHYLLGHDYSNEYWSESEMNYIQSKSGKQVNLIPPLLLIYYNGKLISKEDLIGLHPKFTTIEFRKFNASDLKAINQKLREKAFVGILIAYDSGQKSIGSYKLIREMNKFIKK